MNLNHLCDLNISICKNKCKGGQVQIQRHIKINLNINAKTAKEPFASKFSRLKKLNPPFMQKIFKLRTSSYSSRNPNDLAHIRPNQTTLGSKSLMFIGTQIWNNLPNELKSAENLKTCKRLITNWDGPSCRCSACQCLPM